MKLIKDTWYKNGDGWYFKLDKDMELKSIHIQENIELIDFNKHYNKNKKPFFNLYYPIIEVNIDEIISYLPDNHPDKIKIKVNYRYLTLILNKLNII